MTERIDPLGILATAGVLGAKGSPVESRVELTSVNICPIPDCGKEMVPVLAHGIPSNVCQEHKVVLPQKNVVVTEEESDKG